MKELDKVYQSEVTGEIFKTKLEALIDESENCINKIEKKLFVLIDDLIKHSKNSTIQPLRLAIFNMIECDDEIIKEYYKKRDEEKELEDLIDKYKNANSDCKKFIHFHPNTKKMQTTCGWQNEKISTTETLGNVTCPDCLEQIKKWNEKDKKHVSN